MNSASIKEVLLRGHSSLTPSEEKIVQLLLADYPTSGLGTATNLAKKAGVSDATVVRLVMKLGFEGFPDFQRRLLTEVEARLHSPLLMMETKRTASTSGGISGTYLHAVSEAIDKTIDATPPNTYERAAKMTMEAKGRVVLLGGRFSRHLAGMLGGYLSQFRSNIVDLGAISAQTFDTLIDLGKRDVLIVFDYRRYQLDVVAYTEQAAAQGVSILLFTDQWLSPIAEHSEVTIICPLDVPSPYDTLAPAVAQLEAFTAQILADLDERTRRRIERLEQIRHANSVTLDDNPVAAAGDPSRRLPGPKNAGAKGGNAE